MTETDVFVFIPQLFMMCLSLPSVECFVRFFMQASYASLPTEEPPDCCGGRAVELSRWRDKLPSSCVHVTPRGKGQKADYHVVLTVEGTTHLGATRMDDSQGFVGPKPRSPRQVVGRPGH